MARNKQMMSAAILVSCFGSNLIGGMFATPTQQYKYGSLTSARAEIQTKYIDLSTMTVAQRAKDLKTDVAVCFEQDFLTDPTGDEPISEKRRTQRRMQLVREACNQQDVSGLTLEVNEFREDVATAFQNKEDALTASHDGLWSTQLAYGAGIVLGVAALIVASQVDSRSNFAVKAGLGLTGGATVVGTTGGLIYTTATKDSLKLHISKVETMKNRWENSSTRFKQSKNK